jgi:hypothetical protein
VALHLLHWTGGFTHLRPVTLVVALTLALWTGCNRTQTPAAGVDAANGNLAPTDPSSSPPEAAAPPVDQTQALDSADAVEAPDPPPALPDYSQPPCPGDGYMWTPGYWDYASTGYYWVPGAWVMAPSVGALWTPPWWGFDNGAYLFHAGYWGPYIGFYGGIAYGFGYTGHGYYGAYWRDGSVFYNREVTNINSTVVHNVYNYRVASVSGERLSYNGGPRGLNARADAPELAALRARRAPAVPAQVQQAREAAGRPEQFAAGDHPHPQTLTAERPLATENRAPAPAGERPQAEPADRAARPPAPEEHAAPRSAPERPAPAPHPAPEEHAAPPHPAPQQHPAPEHREPPPPPRKKDKV